MTRPSTTGTGSQLAGPLWLVAGLVLYLLSEILPNLAAGWIWG